MCLKLSEKNKNGGENESFEDYSGLLQVLRLKTLEGELEQTEDDNLKKLRPQRNRNYMTGKRFYMVFINFENSREWKKKY